MSQDIVAPMPGTVIEILVKPGDTVKADDEIVILESMKMENPICATSDGTVKEIKISEQDKVDTKQVMVIME